MILYIKEIVKNISKNFSFYTLKRYTFHEKKKKIELLGSIWNESHEFDACYTFSVTVAFLSTNCFSDKFYRTFIKCTLITKYSVCPEKKNITLEKKSIKCLVYSDRNCQLPTPCDLSDTVRTY